MKIPVFFSYPKPFSKSQQIFVDGLRSYLDSRNIEAVTLGESDYDMTEPLTSIRRLINTSCGMITVAFRRAQIITGFSNPNSDVGRETKDLSGKWITSPYCQIEPAMAYQIGLPILLLRESGVIAEGIFGRGSMGVYLPEFDLSNDPTNFFTTEEFKQLIFKWESYVRAVDGNRGKPPVLYKI